MLTVFTPTYNRAYTIEKLYRSLQSQTNQDFEWIVVDDGSTDNTDELIAAFKSNHDPFPITYVRTENKGKHNAINVGVGLAKGELFFIVDSDDFLTDDAIEKIRSVEKSISDKKGFAGVCAQKGGITGIPLGHTFQGERLDCTYLECKNHGIWGDKAEIYYTEIMKKYPFPVFEGERFLTESVVWDRIARDGYKLRYFNSVIYLCEYLEDGLTSSGNAKNIASPRGWGLYIAQSVKIGKLNGFSKWNKYNEYYRLLHKKIGAFQTARNLSGKPIRLLLMLYGYKLFKRIYGK